MIYAADQAAGLRTREESSLIPLRRRAFRGPAWTLAVTSGKGGVGKTQLAANIGAALASRGLQVLLLDADLGLASLDLALGLQPKSDLRAVLRGEASIEDIAVRGPMGLKLIPACPGRYDMANLGPAERSRLIQAVHEAAENYDVLLIDTGAGIGSNAVYFASAADEILLTTTPDPTALRDAYAMVKILHRRASVDRIKLVANMVHTALEGAELHARIDAIVTRFLSLDLDFLGSVPWDKEVAKGARRGRPHVLEAPLAPASRAVLGLAARLREQRRLEVAC
ncbi:MAG: MinD/ParA family protein [Myxococcota bacterium]